jgi:hypothetical protein
LIARTTASTGSSESEKQTYSRNQLRSKHLKAEVAARLPSSPEHKQKAFLHSGKWWADNRSKVSERWSQWLLQKG